MKLKNIPNINYLWSSLIVEELVRNGVAKFCIAPGSRSTPLTISAAECDKAEKVLHFDERGLGFYALGIGSGRKGPAVLISTSGTAVANFLPAVIEAFKKKVPLILLTADRPPELRKTGALQTIDQPGIFGKYVKWEFDLSVPDINIKPEMVLTTIDQAFFMATSSTPGPVHINCMFREPLAPEEVGGDWKKNIIISERWLKGSKPYTKYINTEENTGSEELSEIVTLLNQSENGIIVAGKLKNGEKELVKKLAETLNWPVFPDLTSGLRLDKSSNHIIHYFDQVLLSDIHVKEKIDSIIHLGGRITSKRYYQFVEKSDPDNYITVLNHPLRNDPLHKVSHRVRSSVSGFAGAVIPGLKRRTDKNLLLKFRKLSEAAGKIIDEFVTRANQLNEIFISREVSKGIIPKSGLFLSNSMPVRDMDMYSCPDRKDLMIGGNRGASGIDGIIASACGYASSIDVPLSLVIGDLAFLHDINSLSFIKNCTNPIVIVVINNNGGSIFSFLPIASYKSNFEKYFTTPHGMDFEHIAKQFGIKYSKVETKQSFSDQYRAAVKSVQSSIIEVIVNAEENVKAHQRLQNIIKNELGKINHDEGE